MTAPSSDKVFAGSVPQIYDRLMVPMVFAPYAHDLAGRIKGHRPRDLLEIAAGTGAVTTVLAAELPDTHITATDLNEPMLAQAKTHLEGTANVTWQQADALSLRFGDASFDIVACQFGAMFFPDRVKGYAEARRVLRPGGRFLFNVWDKIEDNDFANVMQQTMYQMFPVDPPQFMARTPHGYHDAVRIRDDLAAAGFRDIKIETVTLRSPAASPQDAAIAYCQGTPTRGEIEAQSEPSLEVATRRVAEALAQRFGTGPIEGKIQALVISAA